VRAAWIRLATPLEFKIFSAEDVAAFQSFAATWAEWDRTQKHTEKYGVAVKHVDKHGNTRRVVSPEAKIWMDLTNKLMGYFARYGMTPADRARVKVVKGARGAEQENPDDEFTKEI
jgi:hypothetical protein